MAESIANDGKREKEEDRQTGTVAEVPITCVHNVEILTRFAAEPSRLSPPVATRRGRAQGMATRGENKEEKEEEI